VAGGDLQDAARGHSLEGIDEEVDQDLFHFVAIQRHPRQIRGQRADEADLGGDDLVVDQQERAFDQPIQVLRLRLEVRGGGKLAPSRATITLARLTAPLMSRRTSPVLSLPPGRLLSKIVQPHQNGLQGVLDFVGHAGGQGAEGFQFRGLDQFQLGPLQFLMGGFEFLVAVVRAARACFNFSSACLRRTIPPTTLDTALRNSFSFGSGR